MCENYLTHADPIGQFNLSNSRAQKTLRKKTNVLVLATVGTLVAINGGWFSMYWQVT